MQQESNCAVTEACLRLWNCSAGLRLPAGILLSRIQEHPAESIPCEMSFNA